MQGHKCVHCERSFPKAQGLKVHMALMHKSGKISVISNNTKPEPDSLHNQLIQVLTTNGGRADITTLIEGVKNRYSTNTDKHTISGRISNAIRHSNEIERVSRGHYKLSKRPAKSVNTIVQANPITKSTPVIETPIIGLPIETQLALVLKENERLVSQRNRTNEFTAGLLRLVGGYALTGE